MFGRTALLQKTIFLCKCIIYMFYLFNVGVLAFLFFTQRLPVIAQGPASLNYYWVPLLVRVGVWVIAGCSNKNTIDWMT